MVTKEDVSVIKVGMRREQIERVDRLCAAHAWPQPSRAEMIRRWIDAGLRDEEARVASAGSIAGEGA